MARRQRDHDAFAPEPITLSLAGHRITGIDGNLEPAGVDAGEEASACALIRPDFDLGEPNCSRGTPGMHAPAKRNRLNQYGNCALEFSWFQRVADSDRQNC